MGSSPVLAFMLPFSVVIGAIVYFTTGSLAFAVLALLIDAVPVSLIYRSQLKARRDATTAAQDRLSRYSSVQDDR
jgi:hypothetical protein